MSESPREGSIDIRENQWRIEADRSANGNDPTAERKDPSLKRRMTDRIDQWRMTARAQLIRPKQAQSAPPTNPQPPAGTSPQRKGLQGWLRGGADSQE